MCRPSALSPSLGHPATVAKRCQGRRPSRSPRSRQADRRSGGRRGSRRTNPSMPPEPQHYWPEADWTPLPVIHRLVSTAAARPSRSEYRAPRARQVGSGAGLAADWLAEGSCLDGGARSHEFIRFASWQGDQTDVGLRFGVAGPRRRRRAHDSPGPPRRPGLRRTDCLRSRRSAAACWIPRWPLSPLYDE